MAKTTVADINIPTEFEKYAIERTAGEGGAPFRVSFLYPSNCSEIEMRPITKPLSFPVGVFAASAP